MSANQTSENQAMPEPPSAAVVQCSALFAAWWEKWGVQYITTRAAAEQAFLAGHRHGYDQAYDDCLRAESERHLWES